MKGLATPLIAMLCLVIAGCGGDVSQADYDDLQSEVDQLEYELSAALADLEALTVEREALAEEVENLQTELGSATSLTTSPAIAGPVVLRGHLRIRSPYTINTVTGVHEVRDGAWARHCHPYGRRDIDEGLHVVVRDQTGAVLATGRLDRGYTSFGPLSPDDPRPDYTDSDGAPYCTFPFTVGALPSDASTYEVEIEELSATYSRDDLSATFSRDDLIALDWYVVIEFVIGPGA